MSTERERPDQISFLPPEDAALVHLMRRFVADASRIYEGRAIPPVEGEVVIGCPAAAYAFLREDMAELEQEQLRVLNLNIRNRLLSAPLIYQGTLACTNVRMAEVFRAAVLQSAANVIVAHNHPSGDPTPSTEDVHLTRQLVDAGKLLDIEVLDHIIIARSGYASLRERGLLIG